MLVILAWVLLFVELHRDAKARLQLPIDLYLLWGKRRPFATAQDVGDTKFDRSVGKLRNTRIMELEGACEAIQSDPPAQGRKTSQSQLDRGWSSMPWPWRAESNRLWVLLSYDS